MPQITVEMKDLIATQQCFVATVNADGTPNLGPKRSTRVLDDQHIVFNEVTGKQTLENVSKGSPVAIAVVDREKLKGYRFIGSPELIKSGDLFDQAAAQLRQRNMDLKAIVKVKVDRIFNLGMPGAGQEIL